MAGYTPEEYEQRRTATSANPSKGSLEWAEQNSGDNAPAQKPTAAPLPGTKEAHVRQATEVAPKAAPAGDNAPKIMPPADVKLAPVPGMNQQKESTTSQAEGLLTDEQMRRDAVKGHDQKIEAWRRYLDNLPEPETPEQREKREKRERSKRIIGAVSDGLRAMSNLWFTSQYAPDMYNHEKTSQLNETNRWIDKAKAERDKNRDEYFKLQLGLGDLENERAKTLRDFEGQLEKLKGVRAKRAHDAVMQPILKAIAEAKRRKEKNLADKAEQDAIAARHVANNKPESLRLDNEVKKRRAAGGTGRSGGGSGRHVDTWPAYNPDTGEEIQIKATSEANAWSQCPKGFQIRQKPTNTSVTTETKNIVGDVSESTSTTTTRNPEGRTGGIKPPSNSEGKATKKTNVKWK
ncbi:MAG: hypothetical protein PUC94_01315 [Bacteroidales bacterium]|nr:hypothetical protein [Bacteroidales bacterium]